MEFSHGHEVIMGKMVISDGFCRDVNVLARSVLCHVDATSLNTFTAMIKWDYDQN